MLNMAKKYVDRRTGKTTEKNVKKEDMKVLVELAETVGEEALLEYAKKNAETIADRVIEEKKADIQNLVKSTNQGIPKKLEGLENEIDPVIKDIPQASPAPISKKDLPDLMKGTLLENYNNEYEPLKTYIITEHFSHGNLLENAKDFVEKLNDAYHQVKNDLGANFDEAHLNHVTNNLKAGVYQSILKKQESVREERWNLAWKLSAVGMLLPIVSHLIIWGWYLFKRVMEPLRSTTIDSDKFVEKYSQKHEDNSVDGILDALQEKTPVREKNHELRARRAIIQIEDENEADDKNAAENVNLSKSIQIIKANWGHRTHHFKHAQANENVAEQDNVIGL